MGYNGAQNLVADGWSVVVTHPISLGTKKKIKKNGVIRIHGPLVIKAIKVQQRAKFCEVSKMLFQVYFLRD